VTEQDKREGELPPDVARRMEAAETEEAMFQAAMSTTLVAMHQAQVTSLLEQVNYYRSRAVDLNVEVRQKDAELEQLRAQVAAYQASAAIEAEAAKLSEPEPDESSP